MSGGQPTAPTAAPHTVTQRESTKQRVISDPVLRKTAWLYIISANRCGRQHCQVAPQTLYFRFKNYFGSGLKQVHDRLR